jgi:hypothetical protein
MDTAHNPEAGAHLPLSPFPAPAGVSGGAAPAMAVVRPAGPLCPCPACRVAVVLHGGDVECPNCGGEGGSEPDGLGYAEYLARGGLHRCETCDGSGEVTSVPCEDCGHLRASRREVCPHETCDDCERMVHPDVMLHRWCWACAQRNAHPDDAEAVARLARECAAASKDMSR